MTQFYLVSVERMCTSDEADLISKWSAVIAEEDLPKLTLPDAAKLTEIKLATCPLPGVRPMTEAEIEVWRKGQKEPEMCGDHVLGSNGDKCFECFVYNSERDED